MTDRVHVRGAAGRWLALILVAVAARALTLGNPVVHVDEEFYYFTGSAIWHHALPFVDVWDRKPVGLFLLYALPAALGFPAGIWGYQLLALGSVVATAWMIARLAERAGFRAGAMPAAIAYILWLDLLGGQGGQSPVFYNRLMIGAATLIARGGRGRGIAAMALVGVTMQIKYSAVFEGAFFGLWLIWQDWRRGRRVLPVAIHGLILAGVAFAPTLIAAAFYARLGYWDAFIYANFLSILARRADPIGELAGNLGQIILITSPLLAMAWAAPGPRDATSEDEAATRRFLRAWLIAAVLGVLVFRPWFDHYSLPLLLPACASAAGFFGARHWRGRATPAILLIAALAGQIVLVALRAERGTPAQFDALARAVGKGPGCAYVYSGSTMLYVATGRCALSRYIVPAHLGREREAGATGVDQDTEIRRILSQRPAIVVMRPPYNGERPEAHAIVMAAMARDYRLADRLPMGNETISVYRLRP